MHIRVIAGIKYWITPCYFVTKHSFTCIAGLIQYQGDWEVVKGGVQRRMAGQAKKELASIKGASFGVGSGNRIRTKDYGPANSASTSDASHHVVEVAGHFAAGLFHGYDVPDLPN